MTPVHNTALAEAPRFGTYLIRRARWLEKKLANPEYPGRSWDAGEYADLLAAFNQLCISFDTAGMQHSADPRDPPLEDPPRLESRRVPGPPRGLRFMRE